MKFIGIDEWDSTDTWGWEGGRRGEGAFFQRDRTILGGSRMRGSLRLPSIKLVLGRTSHVWDTIVMHLWRLLKNIHDLLRLCFQKWTRTSTNGATNVCVHANAKFGRQRPYVLVIWTVQSSFRSTDPHFIWITKFIYFFTFALESGHLLMNVRDQRIERIFSWIVVHGILAIWNVVERS